MIATLGGALALSGWRPSASRMAPRLLFFTAQRAFSSSSSSSSSSPSSMAEPSLSGRLWEKGRHEALLALYHPFVVTLAAGTLPRDSFRHYISQDYFFLKAFADAYGLAYNNTNDEAAKRTLMNLQGAVLEELKLHSSYAKAWDVDLAKVSNPNPATTMYIELLFQESHRSFSVPRERGADKGKIAALTIGAMTPCMRLYAFLGQEITRFVNLSNGVNAYKSWIETYSSKEFEVSASQIEELLNTLAKCLSEDELKTLENLYHQALICEVNFFSAQPFCRATHVPCFRSIESSEAHYLLVSDFDSTCSVSDSCPALAELSMSVALGIKREDHNTSSNAPAGVDLKRKWDTLVNSYNEGYAQLLAETIIDAKDGSFRTFDFSSLKKVLDRLSAFELEANRKLVEADVLRGLSMKDVEECGHNMMLQDGCAHLLQQLSTGCRTSYLDAHIISVCWSGLFIQGALSQSGNNSITIHSNELEFCEGLSTGNIIYCIETPSDKLKKFQEIVQDVAKVQQGTQVKTVYIGDSVTDLLCLLEADIGIVVGSNSALRDVASAVGLSFLSLYEGLIKKERSESKWKATNVLYTVSDWHEIHAFLLGPPQ